MTKVNKIEKRKSAPPSVFTEMSFSVPFLLLAQKKAKQLLDSTKLSAKLIKPEKVLTT